MDSELCNSCFRSGVGTCKLTAYVLNNSTMLLTAVSTGIRAMGCQFRHVSSTNLKVCTVNNYNNQLLLFFLHCGHTWHQRHGQNTANDGAQHGHTTFVELLCKIQKQLGGSGGMHPEKSCVGGSGGMHHEKSCVRCKVHYLRQTRIHWDRGAYIRDFDILIAILHHMRF